MTLPNIFHPTYDILVPSLKKSFKFRPFLVKEEKILLMAKESGDDSDLLKSLIQVTKNCSVDNRFDVNKLAIFDLEYVFLRLRAVSVDNICSVSFIDSKDKQTYPFTIDLNTVEVEFPEKIENKISITDKQGIIMKYPMASLYEDDQYLSVKKDILFETILRCVDKIYDGDDVYDASEYKLEEVSMFLENLPSKTFSKIQEFMSNLPTLKHVLTYKNTEGDIRNINLTSLSDFFTLR